jgi:hypothetical protein
MQDQMVTTFAKMITRMAIEPWEYFPCYGVPAMKCSHNELMARLAPIIWDWNQKNYL